LILKPVDIKELRKSLKMTQEDFATALKVDSRTVQKWEKGDTTPRPGTIFMMENLRDRRLKGVKENAKVENFNLLHERASEIGRNYSKVELLTHLNTHYKDYLEIPEFQRMVKLWANKLNYTPELLKAIEQLKSQIEELSRTR